MRKIGVNQYRHDAKLDRYRGAPGLVIVKINPFSACLIK
jgi:hypothetical protein